MATLTKTVEEVPSRDRVEPGSVNITIATFPSVSKTTPPDADQVAAEWVNAFNEALSTHNYSGLGELFVEEGYWRDHLALSWDLRTMKGPGKIIGFLREHQTADGGSRLQNIEIDRTSPFRAPHVAPFDGQGKVQGVETFVTTTTSVGSGQGVVRLVEQNGKWKALSLFTTLQELNGHEEAIKGRRTKGVEHGGQAQRKNWMDRRTAEAGFEETDPAVLIIGAGQGGLTIAARLKMLGVKALIIDQEQRIGDNWRSRYHQLVLHDPVWYDHMPYVDFPAHWPVFTPKDKLAEFFECYAKLLELNVWTGTSLQESSWDDNQRQWTIKVQRTREDGTTEERVFHPRHVVQATGHSGKKNFPSHIKGLATFAGDRLCHSSEFSGAKPEGAGKKAVVVGSCNSGHDIAQDFYENGYEVTMVQRSTTCVISSEAITKIALAGLYEENGPPLEDADLYLWSIPTPVLKGIQVQVTKLQNEHDREVLDGLAKAGFGVDQGPDDAGLFFKYFQRGGGYYINVGASELIAEGKIKIKHGQEIDEVLPHGLRFQDGSELPADEIIFATGYQNMRSQARLIFGDELADRVNDIWGFDEEGEMRTIWRKSGHPGFWFMGGNLALCRYFSRPLALQIKALEAGLYQYGDK